MIALTVTDPTVLEMHDMVNYCKQVNATHKLVDVSDVSLKYDMIAEFTFLNDDDAILFRLKFR